MLSGPETRIKVTFTFLVFQNGALDEELLAKQEFGSMLRLTSDLVSFGAMQSPLRLHPEVLPLHPRGTSGIQLPTCRKGLGSNTIFVIKDMDITDIE